MANQCRCGCGTPVKKEWAQGHDARVKGWLLKAHGREALDAALRKWGSVSAALGALGLQEGHPEGKETPRRAKRKPVSGPRRAKKTAKRTRRNQRSTTRCARTQGSR